MCHFKHEEFHLFMYLCTCLFVSSCLLYLLFLSLCTVIAVLILQSDNQEVERYPKS